MKRVVALLPIAMSVYAISAQCRAQSNMLDNAQHRFVNLAVNDVVYDVARDRLYASVPSIAGAPHGNSIATIDPATGVILDSIFVGSEPNRLAVSQDGSRVYVGVDGARSIRWWQPADNSLGPLRTLTSNFNDPAIAEDLAVPPGRPGLVVVSKNEVASSASGDLEAFTDAGSMRATGFFQDANLISFINPTTMVSFNNSDTSFSTKRWELQNLTLTSVDSRDSLIGRFNNEAEATTDGRIYFTNGVIADAASLSIVGQFTTGLDDLESLVEPIPSLNLTYFVGPASFSSTDAVLKAFDRQTFLQLDSITLPIKMDDLRGELIAAGKNRLAFVAKRTFSEQFRTLSIVSNIPVEVPTFVPEPKGWILLTFASAGAVALPWRPSRSARRLKRPCESPGGSATSR